MALDRRQEKMIMARRELRCEPDRQAAAHEKTRRSIGPTGRLRLSAWSSDRTAGQSQPAARPPATLQYQVEIVCPLPAVEPQPSALHFASAAYPQPAESRLTRAGSGSD
jgi:hypothetical protein